MKKLLLAVPLLLSGCLAPPKQGNINYSQVQPNPVRMEIYNRGKQANIRIYNQYIDVNFGSRILINSGDCKLEVDSIDIPPKGKQELSVAGCKLKDIQTVQLFTPKGDIEFTFTV